MSAEEFESKSFDEYVDTLLTLMKLSNAEAARRTGVDATVIGKWRAGTIQPSIPNLRKFADGLGLLRATMFVRAGLLEPKDVDLDEIYLRLAEGIARLPENRRREHESHLRILLNVIESEIDAEQVADQADKKIG